MKTILIADDLPAHLDLFEVILQRADCRLLRAEDGMAALRLARGEMPDLIFLDIEMPGMNGGEVCRVIKADPRSKSIPIVLVSSHYGPEFAEKCGADRFLPKPVEEPVLLAELEKHLQLHARGEDRLSVDWPIAFWREGNSHQGRLLDISRTGFFLAAEHPQSIGARLAISFPLPEVEGGDRVYVGEAIVVRHDSAQRGGMGCRFFRTTQTGRSAL
ncbi:MAG: response regulator, partial [Thermoanaerobaculia bacterium]